MMLAHSKAALKIAITSLTRHIAFEKKQKPRIGCMQLIRGFSIDRDLLYLLRNYVFFKCLLQSAECFGFRVK